MGNRVGDSVSSVSRVEQAKTQVETTPKIEAGRTERPAQLIENNTGAERLNDLKNFGSKIKEKVENLFGAGKTPPPVFSKEATVTRTGGQVIIDSGAGDDRINVAQDAKTGDITVSVNGESQTFSGRDRSNLVIRAGDGNDHVWVDENVTVNLRIEGGDGHDFIRSGQGHDRIEGGAGNDRIHGGAGNDYVNGSVGDDIVYGDAGNDTVYGGDGNDELYGNADNDYLEGSRGDDSIYGNDGNDTISGGIGDDNLNGNYGDDAVYAGQGRDTVNGDQGANKLYVQTGDAVQANEDGVSNTVVTVELKGNPGGTGVSVVGSDEFRERVEADLEMLRSSPVGRQMLTSFDEAQKANGVTVTIEELDDNNGYADWQNRLNQRLPQPYLDSATGARGTPNSATISYNETFAPTFDHTDGTSAYTPPIAVLYHEMAHAYDYTHGTFRREIYNGTDATDAGRNLRVGERVAVGLPIDHDGDPRTAERTDDAHHPDELTENALREEMNLELRKQYILAGLSKV